MESQVSTAQETVLPEQPVIEQQPVIESQPISPQPKNTWKMISLILFSFVLLFGGYVAYLVTLDQVKQTEKLETKVMPSSSPSDDQVAQNSALKTYTNTTYGYSVTVPSSMAQRQDNRDHQLSINDADWSFGTNERISLEISAYDKSVAQANYNLQCTPEILGQNIKKPEINRKSLISGATSFVQYSGDNNTPAGSGLARWSSSLCFMHNGNYYQVLYQNFDSPTADPALNQILENFTFTDKPGTREAEVGPGTASQWPQYTVSLADTGIAFNSPYGKPITELTSLSQYTKGGVFVTGAQQNKLFSLETVKSCDEALIKSGELCYLEGKRWNQENDKQDVLLDGNHFVSVYLFDPASSAVIHLVQASQGFPIQISTAVDGAGVEDNFKLLLQTFKFTE